MDRFPGRGNDTVMDQKAKSTEIRRRDAGLHESIDVADYQIPRWLSRLLAACPFI